MNKQVVVVAGPAGSGKDTIIREIMKRFPNTDYLVKATSRPPRPNEENGVEYYFMTNDQFQEEMARGNIPEHYYREKTGHYYGTYKPDLEKKLAQGKIVFAQIQIVGARYLKEQYGATTIFIMPPSLDAFEKRVRERAPMSDAEWQERKEFTERELREEAPWYDYRITNRDGKLDQSVNEVVEILRKEGYNLSHD
jgi:guanylate kinase